MLSDCKLFYKRRLRDVWRYNGLWLPIKIPQHVRNDAWQTGGENIPVRATLQQRVDGHGLLLTLEPKDLYFMQVEILDEIGSLSAVAELLGKNKINIWGSESYTDISGSHAEWCLYIDFTKFSENMPCLSKTNSEERDKTLRAALKQRFKEGGDNRVEKKLKDQKFDGSVKLVKTGSREMEGHNLEGWKPIKCIDGKVDRNGNLCFDNNDSSLEKEIQDHFYGTPPPPVIIRADHTNRRVLLNFRNPREKLVQITFEISNTEGSLAWVANKLASFNVDLVRTESRTDKDGKKGSSQWIVVCDTKDAKDNLKLFPAFKKAVIDLTKSQDNRNHQNNREILRKTKKVKPVYEVSWGEWFTRFNPEYWGKIGILYFIGSILLLLSISIFLVYPIYQLLPHWHWLQQHLGYETPWEREPEKVLADVKYKKVTIPGAREQYGVVIVTMTVNKIETEAIRLNQSNSDLIHSEATAANHIKEWISHSFEIFHFLILAILAIIVYSKDVGELMGRLVLKKRE